MGRTFEEYCYFFSNIYFYHLSSTWQREGRRWLLIITHTHETLWTLQSARSENYGF